MLTELERIASRCAAEVIVSFNAHKGEYASIREYLDQRAERSDGGYYPPEGYADWTTLIEIQFYPVSPIGSYSVESNNLADAVSRCHAILDERDHNAD